LLDSTESIDTLTDPQDSAETAGLRYVSDSTPGIRRKRSGKGFAYTRPGGSRLTDPAALRRIRALAIPPAWTDVWICPRADGHIQSTGRDARGRKQYRYHPLFRETRESTKFERVVAFADILPTIRARVREHMALRCLPREKVLATVVHLLDTTSIRVGNADYARDNKSYGLTTLKNRHAVVDGSEVRFRFTGKSGKQWSVKVKDRRVAKIIKACQELPGQELLQYLDDDGQQQNVTSSDVNTYLKEMTNEDITAKDFRTWAGTILAAMALHELGTFENAAQAKRNLREAIACVAARLGNTPTICRKCYVHPEIVNSYLDGSFALKVKASAGTGPGAAQLQPEEEAVVALLQLRLKQNARNEAAPGARWSSERLRAQLQKSVDQASS
jgi:DNA topoisomerase I